MLDTRPGARRGHLPRRRPPLLRGPRAAVRGDGRRLGADHAAPLRARVRAPGDQRHLQRPVPDVPPRRARPGGAAVVARPLHRVVLLPARGRQARRPEVPGRLARALRGRARAPTTRAAGSRHGTSRSTSLRRRMARVLRGRRPARLLPLPPRQAVRGRERRLAAARVPDRGRRALLVYDPYIDALQAALAEVRAIDPEFRAGLEPPPPVGERVRHIARRAKGRARQAATGARRLLRD